MKITQMVPLLLAALLCGGLARANDVLVVDPQPGVHPKLRITLPEGWVGMVIPSEQPGKLPRVELKKLVDVKVPAEMDLLFDWGKSDSKEEDKAMSDLLTAGNGETTQGKNAPQLKLAGKSGHGFYSVFITNPGEVSPGPSSMPDWRCAAHGIFSTDGWRVTFMLLTGDAKSAEFQQGMKLLQEGIAVEAKVDPREEALAKAEADVADLEEQLVQAKSQVELLKAELARRMMQAAATHDDPMDAISKLRSELEEFTQLAAKLQAELDAKKLAAAKAAADAQSAK